MSNQSTSSVITVDEKTIKKLNEVSQKINKLKNKSVRIALIDKISKPLNKITQNINKLNNKKVTTVFKADDKISKSLNRVNEKINKLKGQKITIDVEAKEKTSKASSIKEQMDKIAGVYKNCGAKVVSFAKESVSAAQAQVGNELKVGAVLSLRTKATQGQIDSILRLTSAQQASGAVSDEVQMAGAQQLATYAKNSNSIKTLIPAMNNLLVKQKGLNGTTTDAADVADLMGKGLNGQTEELKNAGIAFSTSEEEVIKFGNEQERAATLAKVISRNVGDANKEMANTDVGAIAQAKNLFLDLKEAVGKMLLPYLGKFAKWFSKNQPAIKVVVLSITKTIINVCKRIFGFLKTIFNFIKTHRKVAKIIGIFIAAFIALMTILSIINVILGLCPLVWIVAVIALVIAAIAGLILYWDNLKAAAASVWESITGYFGNLKDSVVQSFSDMVAGIKGCWDSIIEFLKNPAKGIAEFIEKHTTKNEAETSTEGDNNSTKQNVKKYALGTSYWRGGLTHISERGGEIVDLPNGSRVIPADKSDKLLNKNGASFGNIYITAKGVTAREVINEIVPQLKLNLANM